MKPIKFITNVTCERGFNTFLNLLTLVLKLIQHVTFVANFICFILHINTCQVMLPTDGVGCI